MIPVPSGVRVWLAVGHTDMRRGMNSLAIQIQQGLGRDPHAGDLYVFRGRRGHLLKILWYDGIGMSLYAQAAGARQVHLAIAGRWDGRYHPGAASLHARRDRLTKSDANLAATGRRITVCP
jgi:transposase